MKLSLDSIFVVDRERKDFGDLTGLAASIKETRGLITPITVTPLTPEDFTLWPDAAGKEWKLEAGERRFRAHVFLGWDEIEAYTRETMPPLLRAIIELEENLQRKEFTWQEQVNAKAKIDRLRKEQTGGKWTQEDTARELSESKANVSKDIKLAEALEKYPELATAASKKGALRMLDMKVQLERRSIQSRFSNTNEVASLLTCGDARDWIRQVPTGSVDLCLTDPPYGQDQYESGQKGSEGHASEYDDSKEVSMDLLVDLVPQYLRITKETGWVVICMNDENYEYLRKLVESCCVVHFDYAEEHHRQKENGEWEVWHDLQCDGATGENGSCQFLRAELPGWIWFRPNSQNPTRMPERHAKNMYERLLVVNRGSGRIFQSQVSNVLVHDAEYGNRVHAMQKPLALGIDLITRLTLAGETVADPTFGSGAFLAAAAKLGRRFLGCEQTPLMQEMAVAYVSTYHHGARPAEPDPSGDEDDTEAE